MNFLHLLGAARFCAHDNAYRAGKRWIEKKTFAIENVILNSVVLRKETMISGGQTVGVPTLNIEHGTYMFGLALYIGEGKKYGDNEIVLTNWDHRVLRKALEFYRLLGIEPERIHCRVTLHPGRDARRAQQFWSEALRLPLDQFSKPYQGISPTSRGKRGEKWPYGGCTLSAYSIKLKQKLNRWMDLALEDC